MKTLITILLFSSVVCFGQSPYKQVADSGKGKNVTITNQGDVVFQFDALNASKIIQHELAIKYAKKQDSLYWVLVREFLIANKVDFSRISDKGDSLKVTPNGVYLKLKPKQK